MFITLSHHNRTHPGPDLLPFLFLLWRGRSGQRVQERQLEDTAIARQDGWGRVRMRCEGGRSFYGAEGNGRGGWRGWGRRCGGGAVLPVKPASSLPARTNVLVKASQREKSLHGPVLRWLSALRPLVWGSLNTMARAAAGPRAVHGPYSFHLSAGLTNAELFHRHLRKPQGRFNLSEKEKSGSVENSHIGNITNSCLLSHGIW